MCHMHQVGKPRAARTCSFVLTKLTSTGDFFFFFFNLVSYFTQLLLQRSLCLSHSLYLSAKLSFQGALSLSVLSFSSRHALSSAPLDFQTLLTSPYRYLFYASLYATVAMHNIALCSRAYSIRPTRLLSYVLCTRGYNY